MSLKITLQFNKQQYEADLHQSLDISIPLEAGPGHVQAWYVEPIRIEPVRMGEWVGEVKQGASVNFRTIFFNPHGHGTHTESVGHISKEDHSINKSLKHYFDFAQLISLELKVVNDDLIISREALQNAMVGNVEAIIIRTLPNANDKLTKNYSSSNPPYLDADAAAFLCEKNIKHLLLDLPSVDREQDGGKLLAHHAFWNYPNDTRFDATITEMIYVPDTILDGIYLLNLQTAPFENDATPSRPVLFELKLIS